MLRYDIHMTASWLAHIRALEEKLFGDQLDPKDRMRMKHDGYSWHYRPSHHVESGLITEEDVELLKRDGTLLSVGAHPAYLEHVLIELGVPKNHIVIADSDPEILTNKFGSGHPARDVLRIQFDMHDAWPIANHFDRIIFPESLCISLSNKIEQKFPKKNELNPNSFPHDEYETELLSGVIGQALHHLKPNGITRANGPMCHPNIVKKMQEKVPCTVKYQRFLMEVYTGKSYA